jgi:hypothetical protein
MGTKNLFYVTTAERLTETLEENKDQEFLLFTNFPPDSSYPDSGKPILTYDDGEYIRKGWEADAYSRTTVLFNDIFNKYKFKAVHFITGAPVSKADDKMLKSLSPEIYVTVTRKNNWVHPDLIYEHLYMIFIADNIKEAVFKGSSNEYLYSRN